MKIYIVILILLLFTSTLFSQENVRTKRDSKEINGTQKVLAPQANGDEVIIKDNFGNPLIKITDEGTFGSITLPDSTAAPGIVTNKLYNVNGTLNFNGTALGATGATQINDLTDAKYDGESLFIGSGAGFNDDAGSSDGVKNYNTAIGKNALQSNTTGTYNTASGYYALYSNTTGYSNTASGSSALYSNKTGQNNTASGSSALYSNTTGHSNTANGMGALYFNETGNSNTASGNSALYSNTIGQNNTANGRNALYFNETGNSNTASGSSALYSNKSGQNNTASGSYALYSNTIGQNNTASGNYALYSNTVGQNNTASGIYALYSNTIGNYNVSIGQSANYYNQEGSFNTIIGYEAGKGTSLHNISGNVFLGYQAGYNEIGDNKLYIENSASSTPLIGGDFAANEVYLNGKVGIGTSTPTSSLQVFGNNNWSYSIGNGWGDFNIGNGTYGLAAGVATNGGSAGDVRIWTKGGTERLIFSNTTNGDILTINNDRVGIGTTNPLYKLHVQDNGGAREVAFFHNTDKGIDSDGIIVRAGPDVSPGGGIDYVIFQDGDGTTVGVIDGNGAGGINYNTTSDRRLKTKIKDYTGALEKIDEIQVRKYVRKTNPDKEEIGFIAQELQKVYPQAVSGSPDSDVETDPMMVDYGSITPLLVRAIQEQQDRIKTQDVRIKNLEEALSELLKNQQHIKLSSK